MAAKDGQPNRKLGSDPHFAGHRHDGFGAACGAGATTWIVGKFKENWPQAHVAYALNAIVLIAFRGTGP